MTVQLSLFHGDCNAGRHWLLTMLSDRHAWASEGRYVEPGGYGWGHEDFVCARCGERKREGIAGGP